MWLKATWPGAVVLVIDHPPKAGGSEPIGSQRQGAFADAHFRVETMHVSDSEPPRVPSTSDGSTCADDPWEVLGVRAVGDGFRTGTGDVSR
jgi:hypothetical protein